MRLNGTGTVPASARRIETRALVDEYLLATESLPREEVARIAGVGIATLERWKRSGVQQLNGPIRRRLHFHLATRAIEVG